MSLLTTLDRLRGSHDEDDEEVLLAERAIDPRIEARRREVLEAGDARRRHRWLAIAIITTVVALVYGVARSGFADVDEIVVRGAEHTSVDDLQRASGLRLGEPLVGLDLDGAGQRVRALPWVADARAERSWNGTVTIAVTERRPVAGVVGAGAAGSGQSANGTFVLVDGERRALAVVPLLISDLMPIEGVAAVDPGQLLDPRAQGALDLAQALTSGVRSRVALVRVLPTGGFELGLRPSGRVRIGPATDLGRKLLAIQSVFGQVDLAGVCTVDVRVPDVPVLTRDEPCA